MERETDMKFRPLINIWNVKPADRAAIQPGQWVQAGPQGPIGQYLGQKKSGTDVVAWKGRAYSAKRATLRQYAKAI
jgi:hypothetical protein